MSPCVSGLDHRVLRANEVEHVHEVDICEIGLELRGDPRVYPKGS